jgi:hypothetical protein
MSKSHPEESETIPVTLLERLEREEPEAWFEFFQRVYPAARAAIDQALTNDHAAAVKEARRLVRAYPNDPTGAHGELKMAWDSFRGHFLKKDKPLKEI